VLKSLERCRLDDLYDAVDRPYSFRALSLLDFGNAAKQRGQGVWGDSDTDNPDRTFRYALTQLTLDDAGRCQALEDDAGYLQVERTVTRLEVRATVWDPSGNRTDFEGTLEPR
jgi:hypothetical protein